MQRRRPVLGAAPHCLFAFLLVREQQGNRGAIAGCRSVIQRRPALCVGRSEFCSVRREEEVIEVLQVAGDSGLGEGSREVVALFATRLRSVLSI